MTARTLFDNPTRERPHTTGAGVQRIYEFDNGYAASVVRFSIGGGLGGSYGAEAGRWELAVIDKATGRLIYDTPITDDVIGWLDEDAVEDTLVAIQSLPTRGTPAPSST